MPQQPEAKFLKDLTEVPAGWPLATVIDAFAYLAVLRASYAPPDRAREAVSCRLLELWASQPAEAEAWLERFGELKTATRAERLCEALLRHGAAEHGKYEYDCWCFSQAELLRCALRPAADRERVAAWYLQQPRTRDRCRQLAERLVEAESSETARKRQKLEEETAQRRRLEAELQQSKEESRELSSRLAAAEAEVSSKTAELQTAQSELEHRATSAESVVAEMRKELQQLQGEHGRGQERCEDLANRLKAAVAEHAEAKERLVHDTSEKQLELRQQQQQQQQADSCSYDGSKAELQIQNAVLQERCEQLRQQLAKAESKLDLLQDLREEMREEIGMYKERLRGQRTVVESKTKSHRLGGGISGHPSVNHPAPASRNAVFGDQESDLAEQLGYSLVDEDGASVLSRSSCCSVKQNCLMLDAIFKSRMDFFREGRDLQKGSQVLAGDGKTVLEVVEISKEGQATEVVDLQAGLATLRVTLDHPVQIPDESGEPGRHVYMPAGKLKPGDFVMLDSGEPVALTSAETQPAECKVLKIVFKPDLPVAVFSSPSCILSKGHKKKSQVRRSGMGMRGKDSIDPMDGGASIPDTAAGEYMD
ncbi:unnamed protein product [Symbiodinium sp. CCMP2592]|nr:unnamed protein product [Symbiodinium sp. CCMP2592]